MSAAGRLEGAALQAGNVMTLYAPWTRPPAFVAMELVFLVCTALTFRHALRSQKGDGGRLLFAWAAIFVYGLLMEIGSYNALDNFHHGQFTVMFYHRKLPLYVTVLYPLFIYTAMVVVERYRLSRVAEAFAVGLSIALFDMPFDIAGPDAGFWSWSDSDPNLAYRWLGVPVTSYYWHLTWGGLMALLLRSLWPRIAGAGARPGFRPWKLVLAPLVALMTIMLGLVAFVPFHLLKAAGVADGTVVALLIAFSGIVFARARWGSRPEEPIDPGMGAIACIYLLYFAALAPWLWAGGISPRPENAGAKLLMSLCAILACGSIHLGARRRLLPTMP